MIKKIDIKDLKFNPFTKISSEWALITAGNKKGFNMMTASWVELGHLWNLDVFTIFIRDQRYTKKFVDENKYFTVSFYDDKKALSYCGTYSGRDCDKAKEAHLTPIFDGDITYFKEARLTFVCEKIYEDRIKKECFLDSSIDKNCYPKEDYHEVYVGKIISIYEKSEE